MDLEAHWREVRLARAKRKPVPPTRKRQSDYRHTMFGRLLMARLHPSWRTLSNPDFADALNGQSLMTFEGRKWDATSARTFRLALEKDFKNAEDSFKTADEIEQQRVRDLRDFAVAAIRRSQALDQSIEELEADCARLGLDLCEDRNGRDEPLRKAFEILSLKLERRRA